MSQLNGCKLCMETISAGEAPLASQREGVWSLGMIRWHPRVSDQMPAGQPMPYYLDHLEAGQLGGVLSKLWRRSGLSMDAVSAITDTIISPPS